MKLHSNHVKKQSINAQKVYMKADLFAMIIVLHTEKKLSYCWDSLRYAKISDSGRSANPNREPKCDYVNFISLTELSINGILFTKLCLSPTR